jgi:phosphoglucosamine mutase
MSPLSLRVLSVLYDLHHGESLHMESRPTSLFGTDGVRGIVGADLTPELVVAIGKAFGIALGERHRDASVLLGRDSRDSGPELTRLVSAGLHTAGVRVTDCGIITTPGLCLLARELGYSGAVMISASHNPPQFNGLKLVNNDGEKLPDEMQEHIEQLVLDQQATISPSEATTLPLDREALTQDYLDLLFGHLHQPTSLSGMTVVADCAWGAAWELGPAALARAGAEVIAIHAEPRGKLINHGCGSLHPESLQARVMVEKADLGVAFDGDADRAMFVDELGQVRDGDFTKYVLAQDLYRQGLLDPPVVVGTVMSNPGLVLALQRLGVRLLRTPVGDRYVVAEMKRTGAVLGGEQSGHIVLSELGIGDGIYTALRVCEAVKRSGKTLSELCAPVAKVPQILHNIPVAAGYDWHSSVALEEALSEWTARLGDGGYVLIRPSGTEPLLRIMVASDDAALTQEAVDSLTAIVEGEVGCQSTG